jgi:hypothetical protein
MEPFQPSAGGDVTSLLRLWSDGDDRALRYLDVFPDGSRIYLLRRNEDQPPREIHVVIGWRTLLD